MCWVCVEGPVSLFSRTDLQTLIITSKCSVSESAVMMLIHDLRYDRHASCRARHATVEQSASAQCDGDDIRFQCQRLVDRYCEYCDDWYIQTHCMTRDC